MATKLITSNHFRKHIANLLDKWQHRLTYHMELNNEQSIVYTLIFWDLTPSETFEIQNQCLKIFNRELIYFNSSITLKIINKLIIFEFPNISCV